VIEIAATLQNTFKGVNPADTTYDAARQRFLDDLPNECAGSKLARD
jgi:hypothetical protein